MENDIIDSLNDIKYSGKLNVPENLQKAIDGGSKNIEYTELVSYLSKELKTLWNLDEEVNPIITAADSSAFLMELSSFLKEIGCPYDSLTTGHLSDRLNSKYDKLLLLDYLLSELMAARMVKFSNPTGDKNELSLTLHETDTAKDLKNLLVALQFNKPPPNITAPQLFQKVETKIRDTLSKNKVGNLIGKPAFNGHLSEKQWDNLCSLQRKMNDEYTIRREMLIKRLDVTMQSFQWSEKTKGKEGKIKEIYNKHAVVMTKEPSVDVSDLLAARDDITILEKTSSASVRKNTQTSINKVIIGLVPDRGGRPSEQAPPPPEMPSWQQRASAGGVGGGRGGSRGGGGGGRGGGGGGRGGQNYGGGGSQGGHGGGSQGGYGGGGGGGGNQGGGGYGGGNQGGYGGGNQGGHGGGNQGGQGGHGGGNQGGQGGHGGGNQGGQGGYGGGNRGGQNYRGNNNSAGGGGSNRGTYNTYNQPAAGSYADQYVQDSSRNQEYSGNSNYNRGGSGRGGGGRSNYNRGGYR